jgi:ribosome-binding protein aMBF1 (putative translation factor)
MLHVSSCAVNVIGCTCQTRPDGRVMDTKLAAQIGQAVRQARLRLKLSQQEVAERLEKSPEFYGRLERGATLPSIETLADLIRVLEVGADTLMGKPGGATGAKTSPRPDLS